MTLAAARGVRAAARGVRAAAALQRHRDAARRRARRDGVGGHRDRSRLVRVAQGALRRASGKRVEQEIYVVGRERSSTSTPTRSCGRFCSRSCSFRCSRGPRPARRPTRACCRSSPTRARASRAAHGVSRARRSSRARTSTRCRRYVHPRTQRVHTSFNQTVGGDGPPLVERSESSEHPDSARARARHSARLRAARRDGRSSPPTIRRSSCGCSRISRTIRRSCRRSAPAATSIGRRRRSSSTCRSRR